MPSFLDASIGILLVVLFLGTLLHGVGMLQCWLYFCWYPRDGWRTKSTVLLLLFVETFQIAVLFSGTYKALITNFGNIDAILVVTGLDSLQSVLGFISALIVQFYFARTLYVFSRRNIYYSLLIVALSLISFGGGITQIASGHTGHFPSEAMGRITVTIQSGAALACDLAITVCLCVVFRHLKTGIRSTDSVLQTLIVYAIGRGVLTSIAAAQSFICFLAFPGTFYFILGLLLSGKLYMNSMLFSLNSRQHVRNQGDHELNTVSLNFASSGTETQEQVQNDIVKLESSEPISSSMADGTDISWSLAS